MLTPGQTITLTIEKPAAGGRMIGRVDGQVVLVGGTIPGERVTARVERVGKGVAHAETIGVDEPSPDRREPFTDLACGGSLYAHIEYSRQLALKRDVVIDACSRIGHFEAPLEGPARASRDEGYRMRAKLHVRDGRAGFFREGTHTLCDLRAPRQLLSETCDAIERLLASMEPSTRSAVAELDLSENVPASQRAAHVWFTAATERRRIEIPAIDGLTGVTAGELHSTSVRLIAGEPTVTDVLEIDGKTVSLRRHVLAFFQGNRYLLRDLVNEVVQAVPPGSDVIDLYAGVGLFSVAAAVSREAQVTAVEGDRISARDLAANARDCGAKVEAVHQPVEEFVSRTDVKVDVLLVDPPRTGMSKEALAGAIRLSAPRVIYVSCDVATMARDSRRLLDAGYAITKMDAFDLFPNTPHVETVAVFQRS